MPEIRTDCGCTRRRAGGARCARCRRPGWTSRCSRTAARTCRAGGHARDPVSVGKTAYWTSTMRAPRPGLIVAVLHDHVGQLVGQRARLLLVQLEAAASRWTRAASPRTTARRWRTSWPSAGCGRPGYSRSTKPAASRVASFARNSKPVMCTRSTAICHSCCAGRRALGGAGSSAGVGLLDEAVPCELAQVIARRAGGLTELLGQAGDAGLLAQVEHAQDLQPQRVRHRFERRRLDLEHAFVMQAKIALQRFVCK